ncbi:hypothetical protein [Novosphingobium sp.]|uniref:hypothetical protein n=1 Tax=Novosphingobium sp. TaxID=1874826 RepID=UPI0025F2BD55|nr:hypothetical protein [Novosphingobium sp.]
MRKTTLLAALAPMVLGGLSAPAMAQDWNHNDRSVERHDNDGRTNKNGYDNRGRDNRGYNNRGWQMTPQRNEMIRADIEQLDMAISRSQARRTISPREAAGLKMQARDVKRLYYGYARDGLNRNEVYALEQRVNQIRGRLQMERRDWNNWRG